MKEHLEGAAGAAVDLFAITVAVIAIVGEIIGAFK